MRRPSLGLQVFMSILGVSLFTVAVVGFFARTALSRAFDTYLQSLQSTGMMRGRGMGRMFLGAAEQTFIASVDRGVLFAAAVAMAIAAAVAILLASYLTRPLRRLEDAAEGLGEGDLSHRVASDGPAEVAAIGEAFNRMAASLERAEDLRRKMVADVAHELRNPLAAARAQAEGMVDGVVPVTPDRLGSLVEDLQHLSSLVDDLQELAIAEAGRLRYDMDDVAIAAVVRSEVERARPLVHARVALSVSADNDAVVEGDDRRLAQVVRNLLSNAARHTTDGSIVVRVSREPDRVVVSVTDTGEGIGESELPFIFDRFYRADAARSASTGGAGLGLAISRSIVRDHGGDVFARSASERGSEIGFWLPLKRD